MIMHLNRRFVAEIAMAAVSGFTAIAIVSVLFMIVGQVFIGGLPSLSWYFISTPENATPAMGQGIANAIIGTVMISLSATIVAAPFGLGTAIYMKRYATDNKITQSFRFLLEVLSGTPSIVVGIFGFLVFVYYLKPITGGWSLIAGSLALAILIMPVIERSIEEAIDTVSHEIEEASYALGANKWQTIRDITIPAAFAGVLTSFTLGFGRAAEESAVVILTAGYTQYMPELGIKSSEKLLGGIKIYPIQDQVATLPYAVYHAFQNSNVVKPSAGFAAAFVLIVVVFSINITGKALLKSSISTGNTGASWYCIVKSKIFPQKKSPAEAGTADPHQQGPEDLINSIMPPDNKTQTDTPLATSLKAQIVSVFSGIKEKTVPVTSQEDSLLQDNPPSGNTPARLFIRTLLPFAIPAALLMLIAFLATIPPLHRALGPANPSLAGLFSTALSLIIAVAGLVFGLLLAKKSGAFRGKTRRIGYAGVVTGFCLVCIAGLITSSAAAGLFSTGAVPAPVVSGEDRSAKLASMLASGELGSDQPAVSEALVQNLPAPAPAVPPIRQGNDTSVPLSDKNALSLGEYYWYGDPEHTCRATIYDYKEMPFYFWWWIDYNRFVLQVPEADKKYLAIFIRIENTGTESAVIPSADRFNISSNGGYYNRLPYLNRTVFSDYQFEQFPCQGFGNENLREQYYQWIREIGQDKRDYAYLTGQNLFRKNDNDNSCSANTDSETDVSAVYPKYAAHYNATWLKPGPSQSIDGYLIYEVPAATTGDLKNTYVDVSFNNLSGTRWRLG